MPKVNRFPHSLAFRLDDAAAAKLRDVADAYGLPPAAFARTAVLRAIDADMSTVPVQRRVANADLVRQAVGELGRQGSNLNQIARAMNAATSADAAKAALIRMEAEHAKALRDIRLALSGRADP